MMEELKIVGPPEANQSPTIGKLAEALAKTQGAIKPAKKDSENPFFHSQYADLSSVWEACRKELSQNNLAVIQTIEPSGAFISIITTLAHSSGEWIRGRLVIDPPKNQKGISDIQAMGSAITYARRYSLAAMVGIAPEDDDAEMAMKRGQKSEQRQEPEQPGYKPRASGGQVGTFKKLVKTLAEVKGKLEQEIIHSYCEWTNKTDPTKMSEKQLAKVISNMEKGLDKLDTQKKPEVGSQEDFGDAPPEEEE